MRSRGNFSVATWLRRKETGALTWRPWFNHWGRFVCLLKSLLRLVVGFRVFFVLGRFYFWLTCADDCCRSFFFFFFAGGGAGWGFKLCGGGKMDGLGGYDMGLENGSMCTKQQFLFWESCVFASRPTEA